MNSSDTDRNIKKAKCILSALAVGVSVFYVNPQVYAANTVPANNTLPSGGSPMSGVTIKTDGSVMNIDQGDLHDAYITWKDFSIGANAVVNFNGTQGGVQYPELRAARRQCLADLRHDQRQ